MWPGCIFLTQSSIIPPIAGIILGQLLCHCSPLPLLTIPGDCLHLHQLLVTLAKVRGRFPEFTHIHHGGGREKWGVNNKRSWRFEAADWKRMMPRLKGQGPLAGATASNPQGLTLWDSLGLPT